MAITEKGNKPKKKNVGIIFQKVWQGNKFGISLQSVSLKKFMRNEKQSTKRFQNAERRAQNAEACRKKYVIQSGAIAIVTQKES